MRARSSLALLVLALAAVPILRCAGEAAGAAHDRARSPDRPKGGPAARALPPRGDSATAALALAASGTAMSLHERTRYRGRIFAQHRFGRLGIQSPMAADGQGRGEGQYIQGQSHSLEMILLVITYM